MRKRIERFFSNSGDKFIQNYTATQLGDGIIRLVPSDTTDIDEYINSFAESCSIEHILAMCASGDLSALSRTQGAYIDTTAMPKTFRDMLDIVIDGRAKFDSLPLEIRQKFGNDFESWFSGAGEADWLEKMGFVESESVEEKEVKQDAES